MVDTTLNQEIEKSLREVSGGPESGSDDELAVWACPICDSQFSSTAAVKTHARRAHKIIEPSENIFDRTKHAVNGLPQCAGCLKKFSRWQTLQQHINNHSCPPRVATFSADILPDPPDCGDAKKFEPQHEMKQGGTSEQTPHQMTSAAAPATVTAAGILPTSHVEGFNMASFQGNQLQIQKIVIHGLNHFIQYPALTQDMLHTCVICRQWVASRKVMKLHYQNTRSQIFRHLQRRAGCIIEQRATPCATFLWWQAQGLESSPTQVHSFMAMFHALCYARGEKS